MKSLQTGEWTVRGDARGTCSVKNAFGALGGVLGMASSASAQRPAVSPFLCSQHTLAVPPTISFAMHQVHCADRFTVTSSRLSRVRVRVQSCDDGGDSEGRKESYRSSAACEDARESLKVIRVWPWKSWWAGESCEDVVAVYTLARKEYASAKR